MFACPTFFFLFSLAFMDVANLVIDLFVFLVLKIYIFLEGVADIYFLFVFEKKLWNVLYDIPEIFRHKL